MGYPEKISEINYALEEKKKKKKIGNTNDKIQKQKNNTNAIIRNDFDGSLVFDQKAVTSLL